MPTGSGSIHITADFRSISGMFPGNPVTVLGLRVGRVDRIVPYNGYAEVHMSLDRGVTILENVTAAGLLPIQMGLSSADLEYQKIHDYAVPEFSTEVAARQ